MVKEEGLEEKERKDKRKGEGSVGLGFFNFSHPKLDTLRISSIFSLSYQREYLFCYGNLIPRVKEQAPLHLFLWFSFLIRVLQMFTNMEARENMPIV